jgi:hypothetical protein
MQLFIKPCVIGALLCSAIGFAGAQGTASGRPDQAAAGFTCGGVGQGEQDRIKGEASSHHALVTFSSPGGAYVAGVEVKVTGRDGKVVAQGTCNGPLMLLDVPASGRYRIDAAYGGREQHKDVELGKGTARISFTWNEG